MGQAGFSFTVFKSSWSYLSTDNGTITRKVDYLHRLEIGDVNAVARLQLITEGVTVMKAVVLDSGYQVLAVNNTGALDPAYQHF